MIDGTVITGPDGVDHHLGPDDVRARFEKRERPRLDRLRSIVGAKRTADLLEWRDLLNRLRRSTSVARRALEVLQPTQKRLVAKLREQLDAATVGVNFEPGE